MSLAAIPARFGRAALFACVFAAATGCTIHRLPIPAAPPCAASTATVSELWRCVERRPVPDRRESGVISSIRAASIVRKRQDQDEGRACEGPVPTGYELKSEVPLSSGRPPLRALWSEPSEKAPIILVVHGLYDSKFSKYVRVTSDLLRAEGFGVLAPDMRWHGCLLKREWLPTLGVEEGRDLVAWAEWIRRERPGHPIGLIGFSLGGLAVLHAAGEAEAADLFDAGVIAVSPAGALAATAADLDSPAPLADRGLIFVLRASFRGYLRHRTGKLGAGAETESFQKFLGWLVEHAGYPAGTTLERLLAGADPAPVAGRTRRPVLVLASRNDPIISPEAAGDLARAAKDNPYLRVIDTPFGGHIGQIGLFPDWMADVIATFFRASPRVPPKS